MAFQLTTGRTSPTTQGPIEQVPCPHCGKPNDFSEAQSQQLLDTGNDYVCDSCGNLMTVTQIRQATVVAVRPSLNRPRRAEPAPQQARTIGPGAARKLLRR